VTLVVVEMVSVLKGSVEMTVLVEKSVVVSSTIVCVRVHVTVCADSTVVTTVLTVSVLNSVVVVEVETLCVASVVKRTKRVLVMVVSVSVGTIVTKVTSRDVSKVVVVCVVVTVSTTDPLMIFGYAHTCTADDEHWMTAVETVLKSRRTVTTQSVAMVDVVDVVVSPPGNVMVVTKVESVSVEVCGPHMKETIRLGSHTLRRPMGPFDRAVSKVGV
jgi:hypothetical protein